MSWHSFSFEKIACLFSSIPNNVFLCSCNVKIVLFNFSICSVLSTGLDANDVEEDEELDCTGCGLFLKISFCSFSFFTVCFAFFNSISINPFSSFNLFVCCIFFSYMVLFLSWKSFCFLSS